jgi:hypothetical protein
MHKLRDALVEGKEMPGETRKIRRPKGAAPTGIDKIKGGLENVLN